MMNRKICTAITCLLSASVSAFGDATFSFTNQWSGGGQGAFRISNGSTEALQGWTLEFDWNAEIGSVWNGVIQSHVGNHYVITPAAYNAELPAGRDK